MLSDGQALTTRYKIIKPLKKGGMGTVYEASDLLLNARVAIKENLFDDESLRAAFRREAQLLANLRHPSLPRCSDLFSVENRQYFVMEFIEGDDLATLMARRDQPLPAATVVDWAQQLLDVLEYLHQQPALHRDIKPLNIKVKNGRVYLLDFGLAYGQSGDMTTSMRSQVNWHCHSPKYSPLEQLRGERTAPASDLYSLAATLYVLLTGEAPHDAEYRWQMVLAGAGDPLSDLSFRRPDLDKNVSLAIMRALSLNINQRPQSAAEMCQMMFAEQDAQPEAKSASRFMRVGALAGILPLVMLTGALLPGLQEPLCQSSLSASFKSALRCEQPQPVNPAPELSPSEQADLLTDEGAQLLQSGNYEEALKKAAAALALAPDNPYAHFIYGDILWDTKGETAESGVQITEVQEQADIILKLISSPQSTKEYTARAWANLAKGKFEIAVADANAALISQPDSVIALMILASAKSANAEMDNKKAIESLTDYDKVISLRPKYAQAYANRATTYYALGQLKLAHSDLTEAIRLLPRASFYYKLGYVNFNLQDLMAARSNFEDALRKNAEYYQAYLGLADVYFQQEDWNNSAKNYVLANKLSPTHYAFNRLGNVYIYLEKFEAAIDSYNQALELDPNDFRACYGIGFSYASLKNFQSAIDNYTKAIEVAPQDNREFLSYVYKYRAEAFRQSNREELAESDEQLARSFGQ